jgi:hypothetical protein
VKSPDTPFNEAGVMVQLLEELPFGPSTQKEWHFAQKAD